jgi:hypothetical protein
VHAPRREGAELGAARRVEALERLEQADAGVLNLRKGAQDQLNLFDLMVR